MADIQVTLNRVDAQVLLPLIMAQSEDRRASAAGSYWRDLHTAITTALESDAPRLPS